MIIRLLDTNGDLGDGLQENFQKVWWDSFFVAGLLAQGWRVLGSGDGYSFENEGETAGLSGTGPGGGYHVHTEAFHLMREDRFGETFAGNWTNQSTYPNEFGSSWMRLATPADAEHRMELLIRNPSEGTRMEILMLRDPGRFDTGASAWVWPWQASGGVVPIRLGTRDNFLKEQGAVSAGPAHWCPNSGSARLHCVVGDASVDYDFHMWTCRVGYGGEVFAHLGRVRVEGGYERSDGSEDPDPYVMIAAAETGGANTTHDWYGDSTSGVDPLFYTDTHSPERVEDRTSSSFSGSPRWIFATFGINDPAVSPAMEGTYVLGMRSLRGDNYHLLGANPLTGRFELTRPIFVRDDGFPRFFKGIAKHDLVLMTPIQYELPILEELPGGGTRRVHWGRLSVSWDDAQGPPTV